MRINSAGQLPMQTALKIPSQRVQDAARPFGQGRLTLWQAYLFAIVVTAFTLIVRLALADQLRDRPTLIVFTVPILLSAYLGGRRAGFLATALSYCGATYYLLPPYRSVWIANAVDRWDIFFLVLAGAAISVLNQALHDARRQAAVATIQLQVRAALVKAEALQAAIFNSTGFASIATDEKGTIKIFNVGAERMLGYAAAEVVNKLTPADISDPQEMVARATALSIECGTPIAPGFETLVYKASRGIEYVYEPTLIRKNGTRFPAVVSVAALRDAQDAIIGYLLIGTDNTSRKRADARFHRLIDSNVQGVMFWNDRGQIIQANDGFLRIVGYTRHDLESGGMDWSKMTPPQYAAVDRRSLAELAATGTCASVEKEYIRKDGSRVSVLVGAAAFEDDASEGVCFVIDRTENRQAADALRQNQAQLQTIIENISEAVVVSDLNGQLLHFNPAALEMLGYATMEEGRRHFGELATTHELSDLDGVAWSVDQWPLSRILRGEKLHDVEARMRRVGDDWGRIYNFGGTIAHDAAGKPLMAVVTFSDITERRRAESAALLLAAIVESSADAVIGKDLNSIVTSWNDAAERMFGYSAQEMVGQPITVIIPPDHHADKDRFMAQIKRGQSIEHFETMRVRKDGGRVAISLTISPVKDSHGRVIGASKVARDITEHKRAEAALTASEERFRLLVEGVHEYAIVLLDCAGNVVSWNAGAERVKGYKSEAIIGRSFSIFYMPEDIAAGKPAQELKLAADKGRWEDEGWRVRADGTRFWASVLINALKDEAGNLRGFSKLTRDITERKVASEILFKAGALQRAIFNSANFSSIATDAKGVIQIFNVGAERMLGYSAAEVMNKITPADISDPQEVIARAAALSVELGTPIKPGFEALAFKASRGIEDIYALTYIRKDGSRLPAVVSVTALRDAQDAIIGYLLIGTDNTARIEAEGKISRWNAELEQRVADRTAELAETNSDLEAFTYSVSHDLRAPLRAIDGFSRIVETEYASCLPQEATRFLGLVRSNVQQMGQLVEDLLSLCRHGRQAVVTHLVQPDAIARQAWQDLTQWPAERSIAFEVQALDACRADPALLKQVFANLLSNAIKFTRAREDTRIVVGAAANENGEMVYFVQDNGIGFDMRYVHKLFGVFQRLHRAEDYAGTGVGLAIVQRIVKRHGGRVWANSEPDKGTTISFTLGSDN